MYEFYANPNTTPVYGDSQDDPNAILVADFKKWYPKTRKPDANTFEVGIVMAGAISAGAYTAGVMDFLFEALDAWESAKERNDDVPNHKVVLRIISGASAGGINGAIAAVAARHAFPHIRVNSSEDERANNPFYRSWVSDVKIDDFLNLSDLESDAPIKSFLNCSKLTDLANRIVTWSPPGGSQTDRKWLGDGFRLSLTLSNVSGVEYMVRFVNPNDNYHEMVMHKDHISFFVDVGDGGKGPPDHILLGQRIPFQTNPESDLKWTSLGISALATGAFPIALEPREIWRNVHDYDYRYAYIDEEDDNKKIYAKPWIRKQPSHPFKFYSIDGGTFNNEPFDIARTALAGSEGRNPRNGEDADRAVLMIDPFVNPRGGDVDAPPDGSIMGVVSRVLGMFTGQNRFKQFDLTLASASDVYSRFLIAPAGEDDAGEPVIGDDAMACSRLGGFFGFFHEAYRRHNFFLGRSNCQKFLQNWFVLPNDNKFFKDQDPTVLEPYKGTRRGIRHDPVHYQIIPLVGRLNSNSPTFDEALDPWPRGKITEADRDSLKEKIKDRIKKALPALIDSLRASSNEQDGDDTKAKKNLLKGRVLPSRA